MSRSHVLNYVHCIFSTKGRIATIREPEPLWAYLRGIARNLKFDLLAVGGTANHLDVLLAVPPGRPLADVVRDLKANSSRFLHQTIRGFAWQDGYGAISVSPSQIAAVRRYIANQEEHHRRMVFDEEYLAILAKAGVNVAPDEVLA